MHHLATIHTLLTKNGCNTVVSTVGYKSLISVYDSWHDGSQCNVPLNII